MDLKKIILSNLPLIVLILFLIPFYAILYKLYIPRLTAFGCFDDCFNYVGGYFIDNGKTIYKDFFFNHQPLPAIISYFIQSIAEPINIFELILRHRQFVLIFSFLFNALLILRFKYISIPFIIVFELSKFYIFGDRFLAEGMIVYPLVYVLGIALLKLTKIKLYAIDYVLSAIFAWFVIFSREPYVPLAVFLLLFIFWGKLDKAKKISIGIFGVLTALLFIYIGDIKEYYFNVVTFNLEAILPADEKIEMWGPKVFHIFLYPVYLFFYGDWNIFKKLLGGFDVILLIYLVTLLRKHLYKLTFLIILVLGLANLRVVYPGNIFYESFHLIIWYGFLLFLTSFLVFTYSKSKVIKYSFILVLVLFTLLFVTSKSYFYNDKIDEHAEFLTNFGGDLHAGEVIRALSNEDDALFLDRSDDLIYWQAKRMSYYKYTWYTSKMIFYPKYTDARLDMFKNNPPEFYREFGSCPKITVGKNETLPDFIKGNYIRIYHGEKPSCIFVRKDKMKEITEENWKKANELLYNLKPEEK